MNFKKAFSRDFPVLALALMLCGCQLSGSSLKTAIYNKFSSNMLEIPKNTEDFDFLEGRWEDVATAVNSNQEKSIHRTFEFDKYGFGTVWLKESATKDTCIGQALAEFVKDGLEIRTLKIQCPDGRKYLDTVAICREEKMVGTLCHANNIGSNNTFDFTLKRVK